MGALLRIRGSRLWRLFLPCCMIILPNAALGADERQPTPLKAFSVRLIPDPPELQPEVIGGRSVRYTAWPATYYAPEANCTITLVGPRAALLAAHCLLEGQSAITLKNRDGSTVSGDCTLDSYYPSKSGGHDRAICLLKPEVEHLKYETVQDQPQLSKGTTVYLLGFGCDTKSETDNCCLKKDEGTGKCISRETPGNGKCVLREGETEVEVEAGNYTQSDDIFVARGQAVACLGDSGGGVFRKSGESGARRVVGIAQSSSISENRTFVVATSAEKTSNFLRNWSERNHAKICGINLFGTQCR